MRKIRTMRHSLSTLFARDANQIVMEWYSFTWYEVTLNNWLEEYRAGHEQPAWEYFERAKLPRTISYNPEEITPV